ncbi:PRC-barrel domain-containing protein [Oceanibaculum pacificum]|uniref:Photosystem reaction center subunit H n=1 Tax=Oceanibaculum pacificum TaxID=580166 RepID=A0A154VQ53_9PROT|nr:PRC-barrel domain-containing protein [Oceanibaculum pacificum]KZD03395.1 photosystem reaction center subunit H [Oceanibaculum pacificum]
MADLNTKETHQLIASDKVEGTSVRRPNGDKIGSIERVMIDKRSGRVAYAVMSFGGFLGMGEDHYALPWGKLSYNESLDAYEMDVTEDQLRGSPAGERERFDWNDRRWGERMHDYYKVPPYWI